jgi:hypothetical protein
MGGIKSEKENLNTCKHHEVRENSDGKAIQ